MSRTFSLIFELMLLVIQLVHSIPADKWYTTTKTTSTQKSSAYNYMHMHPTYIIYRTQNRNSQEQIVAEKPKPTIDRWMEKPDMIKENWTVTDKTSTKSVNQHSL